MVGSICLIAAQRWRTSGVQCLQLCSDRVTRVRKLCSQVAALKLGWLSSFRSDSRAVSSSAAIYIQILNLFACSHSTNRTNAARAPSQDAGGLAACKTLASKKRSPLSDSYDTPGTTVAKKSGGRYAKKKLPKLQRPAVRYSRIAAPAAPMLASSIEKAAA